MNTRDLRDYATVVAATVALLVFIVNAISQSRSRRIENLTRFNQAHQRLFASDTYLALNLIAVETGTMRSSPTPNGRNSGGSSRKSNAAAIKPLEPVSPDKCVLAVISCRGSPVFF